MTVCIACLCNYTYGPNETGSAVVTVSDRQITAGDIEYDPPQFKISFQARRAIILVSGEYTVHTEALQNCQRTILANAITDPLAIAETYAQAINDVKRRHAATLYLSPLNLTTEIFSGNANASVEILASLANQMQDYRGDVTEALVVAADDLGAHIYHIDKWSLVRCYDDVGFAAIGIGADHAKSQLMRARYSNQWPFSVALAIAYTSKKMSEVAPGVGTETDLFIVNKIGCVPVLPDLRSLVDTLYNEYETQRAQLVEEQLRKLREGIDKLREAQNRQRDAAGPEQSGAGDENPKPTTSGN